MDTQMENKKMSTEEKVGENKIIDAKALANQITIYLSGPIGAPETYIGVIDAIRHANETDIIKFNINSPGGDLFTTIQFLRAITETKALVVASAEGACMSAATMIFLSADRFEISEHCLFMFHNYSGGTFGKGGEMYDQLINERKWSESIIRNVYSGFLTEDEIRSILDNKDIWMEGEEVLKRLEKKHKSPNKSAKKPPAKKKPAPKK
jgi:ATP-dependent protease ClpP protease subunit